jgi:hypothetical protein
MEIEFIGNNFWIMKYLGTERDVIIPEKFNNCPVTTIHDNVFANNNLTNVIIPKSIKFIGYSAFASNNLTNVIIPNSVTYIGYEAFYGNELTSIIIPEKLQTENIIRRAFKFSLDELHHRNREYIKPSLIDILPFHKGLFDTIVDYLIPCNDLVLECVNK